MADIDVATEIAGRVGQLLVIRGWTVGVAESCTGGLVSHSLTNVAGSSAFFIGGVIAYANEVKRNVLGVPEDLLATQGAVSAAVALTMAQGVRRLLHTDVGVATTGIAGPTGGTPQKPVGTVYVAVVSPLGEEAHHYLWGADRSGNKRSSAEAALQLLEMQLRS
jgi:PncC family amidohydrolase